MIKPVKDFVEEFLKTKGMPKKLLEVGSLDVNGSVREMFKCDYTGIDLKDGPSVDIKMDAMDIKKRFREGEFDMVICLETLEHVKDPITIVNNMKWVLRKNGWMLITTPGIGHPEHNWPSDYYRFFQNTYGDIFFEDFADCRFETLIWDSPELVNNTRYPHAVLGYGRKQT